jgi:hypothetical protein
MYNIYSINRVNEQQTIDSQSADYWRQKWHWAYAQVCGQLGIKVQIVTIVGY